MPTTKTGLTSLHRLNRAAGDSASQQNYYYLLSLLLSDIFCARLLYAALLALLHLWEILCRVFFMVRADGPWKYPIAIEKFGKCCGNVLVSKINLSHKFGHYLVQANHLLWLFLVPPAPPVRLTVLCKVFISKAVELFDMKYGRCPFVTY